MTPVGSTFLDEGIPLKTVASPAGAGEAIVQPTAAFADPADPAGRHAGHQCIVLYVRRYDGSGGNQGAASYRVPAHDRAIRAYAKKFRAPENAHAVYSRW